MHGVFASIWKSACEGAGSVCSSKRIVSPFKGAKRGKWVRSRIKALAPELQFMCRQDIKLLMREKPHPNDVFSLTPFSCLKLLHTQTGVHTHTQTHTSRVGKQLLHTFIGNYCWRSHISGRAEFQEKKPGSYVTSAQSWQRPRNRAACRQWKTRTQPQWLPQPLTFVIRHTSPGRTRWQRPQTVQSGGAGEALSKKAEHTETPAWNEEDVYPFTIIN